MFKLVITPSAKRSLKKLPVSAHQTLLASAEILKKNPYAGEKLSGVLNFLYSFHFKFNNTHYRLAYTLDLDNKFIIIHFANTRENFYEKLCRLFR